MAIEAHGDLSIIAFTFAPHDGPSAIFRMFHGHARSRGTLGSGWRVGQRPRGRRSRGALLLILASGLSGPITTLRRWKRHASLREKLRDVFERVIGLAGERIPFNALANLMALRREINLRDRVIFAAQILHQVGWNLLQEARRDGALLLAAPETPAVTGPGEDEAFFG